MSDFALNLFYGVLMGVTLLMFGFILRSMRRTRLFPNMVFVLLMLLGWEAALLLYTGTTSFAFSRRVFDLNLPFVAFLTMAMLLFTLRFYALDTYHSVPVVILLAIVPVITLVLSLTPDKQEFLRENLVVLGTSPVHRVTYSRGFWYWVHAAYAYGCIALTCVIIAVQYRKLPRRYKPASRLLLLGMLACVVGNVLVLGDFLPVPIDFTLVGALASAVLVLMAVRRHQGLDFLIKAREDAFQYLEEAVWILDHQGKLMSCNNRAEAFLTQAGIQRGPEGLAGAWDAVQALAQRVEPAQEEDGGLDYTFLIDGQQQVYNIHQKPIYSGRGITIGQFITSIDVTRNRALIHQLEREAGLDALTGLSNLRSMEREQAHLDQAENLPLGILVADINGLRSINQVYGRQQGDAVLRMVAEVLSATCPPVARIARVSGNEFRILIPRYTESQMFALLRSIRSALALHRQNQYGVTLSMGVSAKTEAGERLMAAMLRADHHKHIEKQAFQVPKPTVQSQA